MKKTILPRIFVHQVNNTEIRLDDPNRNFTPADVQHFYAGNYPILTNANLMIDNYVQIHI
jgi:PRTRC genetic system protein C